MVINHVAGSRPVEFQIATSFRKLKSWKTEEEMRIRLRREKVNLQ